ncbi:MAG: CoA-transferase [Firmicutes bacterium]|nr:CoA-transferase [Alicyclobacillaceae bacterium]MCL6497463.1 CoA-transferase [Bacillota bacterium]
MNAVDYTPDELIIVAMARELGGEYLVSAVTPFGQLAAVVAKHTHAPDLELLATPESGAGSDPWPSISLGQFQGLSQGAVPITMEDVFDAIFRDRFRIWINPAQIDRHGNVNITAIGPWERPKVALVGSRGIPEDSSHLSQMLFYILQHSPRTVVERVDFRSGAGWGPDRERHLGLAGAPTRLVTNLGVFDFDGPDHSLRLRSLHPGVTTAAVQEASGCPVVIPPDPPITPPPTPAELAVLRAHDPLELRRWEWASEVDGLRRRWQEERAHLPLDHPEVRRWR